MIPVPVRIAVSIWLLILSVLDIRRWRLPHLLTTVPVIALGVYAVVRLLKQPSAVDSLALALAFISVLASDTWAALLPAAGALTIAFWWGNLASQVTVVGWLLALALAKAGIVGAGDSKVMMVLLALFPDLRLVACIVVAAVAVSGLLLLKRMGAATPLLLLAVARDGLAGRFPARTGEKGVLRIPLAPAIALGALVYLWGIL